MTLIEIVVVIAIMGILATICIPRNRIRDYKLHSQAKLLTNEIRMARYKVMTEGGSHSIILHENNYMVSNGYSSSRVIELGQDIWLGNNIDKEIRFNPNGSPKSSGSIMIQDMMTMKHYDITIVPYTGRILLIE